jgi:hypothetical protein
MSPNGSTSGPLLHSTNGTTTAPLSQLTLNSVYEWESLFVSTFVLSNKESASV